MAAPLNTPDHAGSKAPFIRSVQVAKGSETTNAQFLAGSMKFSTNTPGSFTAGDHISGTGIQKGTVVTDKDGNDIYISRALTGTLTNGATVTILSDRRAANGGPPAFELKAGTGISIAADAQNATGASVLQITASGGGTASALAADDLTVGDAAVTLTTTVGDITIDAQAGDSDIIFKGTDGSTDTTFLTLDGSEEGKAIFNADVTVGDDLSLISDGAILKFGANEEIKMTHVHNTGILLTQTAVSGNIDLQFRDADTRIQSRADGTLEFVADGIANISAPDVTLNASTKIVATTPLVSLDAAVVQIKNTVNDTASSELKFVKDKGAAGADGDDVGKITFVGDDAAQAQTSFGQILVEVSEADNTDEAGKMSFLVAESDGTNTALTAGLILEGQHATDGVVDVTIGAGTGSVTTIAGNLTVNGTTTTISSTTLEVTDDLITVSKGNDTVANANNSGMEIEATGATNIHWKYIHARTAWQSNVDIDLATTSESLKIAGTDVLTNNTLGSGVVTSSLTTVGALASGSIASGFGTISTGNAITTTAAITGGSLVADNITIDGNTISSTNTNGDITLTPSGVGEVNIAAGNLNYAGTAITSTGAELNLLDGSSAGTVVNSKAVIYSSAGQVKASTLSVDAVAVVDTGSADAQTVANGASHTTFTYDDNVYRTAKFVYQISDGTDFESGEILINYKGASAPATSADIFLTQYAVVSTKTNNASLVSWDAVLNAGSIELQFTNNSGGSVNYDYRVVNTLLIK